MARVCRSALKHGVAYLMPMLGSGITRRLVASLLVISLLVTSGTMAVARHTTDIGTLLVICSGHGYATVLVDNTGKPVERQVVCPDCVLSFPDFAHQPAILSTIARYILTLEITVYAQSVVSTRYSSLSARGPPAQV